ncbi:MAG: twin transmembrane helix small protein [Xanthomonadales bacterium]|nr:twin transmembrane helix small protein [Xanthomonadales bacterium]
MSGLYLLAILCLLGTIASFGWGIYSMYRGGDYDAVHSERLMFARIEWHALAVALLVVTYFIYA